MTSKQTFQTLIVVVSHWRIILNKVKSESTQSEQNDTIIQQDLDILTDQKFTIAQIRNAMSAYIENKNVSHLVQIKKEFLQTISFENTLNVNSPPSINFSLKVENNESLPHLISGHKSKTDSNRSCSSSSNASSR